MKRRAPSTYETREAWLSAAATKLVARYLSAAPKFTIPRVSVGFAPGQREAIGWCFPSAAAADGRHQIFISPTLSEEAVESSYGVLATLLHELCHAALPDGVGHRKPFAKLAEAVGLEGPWTATQASPALQIGLLEIARELGPFPHVALKLDKHKRQSTRMVKLACPKCEMVIRTTRKWLDETGAPWCSCRFPHVADIAKFEETEPEIEVELEDACLDDAAEFYERQREEWLKC